MPESTAKFKSWAIVELMGRQQIAGLVTEELIAGAMLLRVDVPAVTKTHSTYDYDKRESVVISKAIPAYTRYFGAAAIYSITPCSEEIAMAAAKSYGSEPPITLALPERQLPASTGAAPTESQSNTEDDEIDPEEIAAR